MVLKPLQTFRIRSGILDAYFIKCGFVCVWVLGSECVRVYNVRMSRIQNSKWAFKLQSIRSKAIKGHSTDFVLFEKQDRPLGRSKI